jgi:hypothetical protein
VATRLIFTPRYHQYSLDGARVPGVTTVINRALAKPGLVYAAAREAGLWAANHVAELDPGNVDPWVKSAAGAHRDVWDASARRGTLLHDAARQLVNGEPLTPVDEATGEQWPDDVIRSAEQLARFMDEWDAQPVLAERPVFHEVHKYAGTIDLVADLSDGNRWLLDYKTGASGVYPEHALQLAAYRYATHVQVLGDTDELELQDDRMPHTHRAGVVWVRPDGYQLIPVRADSAWFQVFLAMLPIHRWAGLRHEESVGDPLPVPVVAS